MARRLHFETEESVRRMSGVRIFADLDPASLASLSSQMVWRAFAPGEQVLSAADDSADFYVLSEGDIEVRLKSPIGRALLVRRLQSGAHFGELASLTGARRSVDLVAQSPVVTGSILASDFQLLLREHAAFAAALAIDLAHNVAHLTERVYEFAALEMRFRLYGQLLRLANRARGAGDEIVITPAPTHAELAEMIGAQREAVTRELGHLAREGILRLERARIIIIDIDRLADMFAKRAGQAPRSSMG